MKTKLTGKSEYGELYISKANDELNSVNDFINNSNFNLTKAQKEAVVSYAFTCGMLMAEDLDQLGYNVSILCEKYRYDLLGE